MVAGVQTSVVTFVILVCLLSFPNSVRERIWSRNSVSIVAQTEFAWQLRTKTLFWYELGDICHYLSLDTLLRAETQFRPEAQP